MKKKILALAAAVLIGIAMAGCSGGQNTSQQNIKALIDLTDDGGLVANFDKTDKGTGGGSGIMINEGEYLVIDSHLTEGKVKVKVTSGGSDINTIPTENTGTAPSVDHEFEGTGETEYKNIISGDYMVFVNVTEKATGNINFIIKSNEASAETEAQ